MKKYTLKIVYDEETDEIRELEQKMEEFLPESHIKEVGVQMNSQFVNNLPHLTQEIINSIFQAADDSGGLMGDA